MHQCGIAVQSRAAQLKQQQGKALPPMKCGAKQQQGKALPPMKCGAKQQQGKALPPMKCGAKLKHKTKMEKIKAEGTRNSFWVKNVKYDKNWTLEKNEFGEPLKIYGWFEEVSFGEKKGKLKAVVPQLPDEDGNDCRIIGYFDDEDTCMNVILQENHPDYGGVFI